jgi:hypothetical protein
MWISRFSLCLFIQPNTIYPCHVPFMDIHRTKHTQSLFIVPEEVCTANLNWNLKGLRTYDTIPLCSYILHTYTRHASNATASLARCEGATTAGLLRLLAMVHGPTNQSIDLIWSDLTCQMPAANSYHEIWDAMQKWTRALLSSLSSP